jgi:hypothetical protein
MDTQNQTRQVQVPSKSLLTALSSLQLASSRGAFRPEEFVEIGTAYQELYAFLTDLGVLAPPKAAEESAQQSIQPGQGA